MSTKPAAAHYGYRKLTDDLRDQGEQDCENRVACLTGLAGIPAQIGYKRRPGRYGGKPAVVASNTLDRQFGVDAPDRVWVTDGTYIRTHEGWQLVCRHRSVLAPLAMDLEPLAAPWFDVGWSA